MMANVILGTAQFGMAYGLNNRRGKIPEEEVFEILRRASHYGIEMLDTAYSYGRAEYIIGKYSETHDQHFKIISKLPSCSHEEAESIVNASLMQLNAKTLYGYLIHNFSVYLSDRHIWSVLSTLKAQGKIEKIGFSLYYPSDYKRILTEKLDVDILQLPYSALDQRFAAHFHEMREQGIEVHVRSIYLQGLVFTKLRDLKDNFLRLEGKIKSMQDISFRRSVPLSILCLNFVLLNQDVDYIVVGIDNLGHLEEIACSSAYRESVQKEYENLLALREGDENLIVPARWAL